jgi:co-chaperonin GroES (HSP10)
MSDVGLYGFEIPHEFVQPTRDMVIIRIPFPPEKIGSIITPDMTRELLAHNVMAGRIVAMGPIAFSYKDGEGLSRQDADIGDWVLIRPFAGTMVQGGQIMVTSGWRYVSSFQDVIGVIPANKMPAPETLLWDLVNVHEPSNPKRSVPDHFAFDGRKKA